MNDNLKPDDYLPLDLKQALDKAVLSLANPSGHLEFEYRWRILCLLGNHFQLDGNPYANGYYRRRNLSKMVADRAKSVWKDQKPEDFLLYWITEVTEIVALDVDSSHLPGDPKMKCYGKLYISFWENVLEEHQESISEIGDDASYFYASLLTAVQHLWQVINDERCYKIYSLEALTSGESFAIHDNTVDPEDKSSEFYAAIVASESAQYWNNINSNKRRDFWMWWLTVAVPKAWQSVS